ncbi:hypothetical protein EJB05_44649, partial [Eragrostis curvula]
MEGAVQTLLSSAGQLLAEEYRLLHGVGGEVSELRDDLETMNALLIMQSEADDGAADHFVRVWMKQLRELAYDSEDCIDLYKLRIKPRPHDGVRAWLGCLLEALLPRRRLAGEIRALRARATAISERHARYGVDREALRRRSSGLYQLCAGPLMPATLGRAINDDPERHLVVGIEDQVDTLVDRLNDRRGELTVFSVVGFGGLGKTTLAMELCRRLEAHFQLQAMVSLSQEFQASRDLNPLLSCVVEQVMTAKTDKGENVNQEDLGQTYGLGDDDPVGNLEKLLKNKRYLIVIDDVWTIRAWEAVRSKLPENNCGSRIIVTTRIETVATACSSGSTNSYYMHRMRPLKPHDSEKLFLSRAFGSMSTPCPEELRDVMDDILKKCGGLPLAVVSIASVLAGYKSSGSKEKWETICKSIGSQMESNPTLEGMKHIVRLGYDHLPHELKGCMMYLSIFPEDYAIDKYRLLCRWIAEGLVREKRGLTSMEVAESYLEELVSRNMIQLRDDFGYFWKAESCWVHDMLLEVMICKSIESNFVSLLGAQYGGMSYDRIRRLSIQGRYDRRPQEIKEEPRIKHDTREIEEMDVEHVRSLSMFQQKGHKLLDNLDKFPLLRVLDLECCKDIKDHHMRYICRLYLLRFLSLKGTSVSRVPPQIEKLEHLQTLDLRDTLVRGLSGAVKRLYNLERLQISQTRVMMQAAMNGKSWDPDSMWRLPRGLNKMKALREVGFAFLGNDNKVAQEVGELEQLQELSVCVDAASTKEELLEEFATSLCKSHSLRRLIVADVDNKKGALNFLHRLPAPPRLLRYLMIAGGIDGLPAWVGSLTYLVHFNMSWGQLIGDQLFDVLCELPSLKTIGIQNACYVGGELVARTRHRFRELIDLRVACVFATLDAIRFEKGSMSKLETLVFKFHDKAKRIEGIEHLSNIKEVHLFGNKNNPSLGHTLEQLKDDNNRRRLESTSQFQIVTKYCD